VRSQSEETLAGWQGSFADEMHEEADGGGARAWQRDVGISDLSESKPVGHTLPRPMEPKAAAAVL